MAPAPPSIHLLVANCVAGSTPIAGRYADGDRQACDARVPRLSGGALETPAHDQSDRVDVRHGAPARGAHGGTRDGLQAAPSGGRPLAVSRRRRARPARAGPREVTPLVPHRGQCALVRASAVARHLVGDSVGDSGLVDERRPIRSIASELQALGVPTRRRGLARLGGPQDPREPRAPTWGCAATPAALSQRRREVLSPARSQLPLASRAPCSQGRESLAPAWRPPMCLRSSVD